MLIADYEPPDALIVPHIACDLLPVLEAVALAASREAGVILLSDQPQISQRFVLESPHPQRLAIVAAPLDTPWVRDRSPIAVRRRERLHWLLARPHMPERAWDAALFASVAAHPLEDLDMILPQGNLVAGPDGLAFSTARILLDNDWRDAVELGSRAGQLGVSRWLVFDPLPDDPIAHADYYLRFVAPRRLAVLGNEDLTGPVAELAAAVAELGGLLPGLELAFLPHVRQGGFIISPLNWIQLGNTLLIPQSDPDPLTPAAACALRAWGLELVAIPAPSGELGGSLHCLTASVFAA